MKVEVVKSVSQVMLISLYFSLLTEHRAYKSVRSTLSRLLKCEENVLLDEIHSLYRKSTNCYIIIYTKLTQTETSYLPGIVDVFVLGEVSERLSNIYLASLSTDSPSFRH